MADLSRTAVVASTQLSQDAGRPPDARRSRDEFCYENPVECSVSSFPNTLRKGNDSASLGEQSIRQIQYLLSRDAHF